MKVSGLTRCIYYGCSEEILKLQHCP